jgi:hypothetical protein
VKIKVIGIHEKGDADKEYIVLEATDACDLKYYCVADTTYTGEGSISNKLRHFYWFKPKAIKKGDRVVLRTGKGTDDDYTNNGIKVYRLFWGLGSAVWNNDGDGAILFEINTWNTTKT